MVLITLKSNFPQIKDLSTSPRNIKISPQVKTVQFKPRHDNYASIGRSPITTGAFSNLATKWSKRIQTCAMVMYSVRARWTSSTDEDDESVLTLPPLSSESSRLILVGLDDSGSDLTAPAFFDGETELLFSAESFSGEGLPEFPGDGLPEFPGFLGSPSSPIDPDGFSIAAGLQIDSSD